jgi:hypothetical protein
MELGLLDTLLHILEPRNALPILTLLPLLQGSSSSSFFFVGFSFSLFWIELKDTGYRQVLSERLVGPLVLKLMVILSSEDAPLVHRVMDWIIQVCQDLSAKAALLPHLTRYTGDPHPDPNNKSTTTTHAISLCPLLSF